MSKRRKRNTQAIQHNINSSASHENISQSPIQIEIDYDKLADAIVRATKKESDNQYSHSKIRIKIMRFCNGIIYSAGYSYCMLKIINIWSDNDHDLPWKLTFCIILVIIALILFLMQQESLSETQDETSFHFNSNVAFMALIVALLELQK